MDDGGHDPDVSDGEILATFANREDEWLRAEDVAEELPVAFDDADDEQRLEDRLDDLTERGLLERDEGGLPGLVWRLDPEASDEAAAASGDDDTETDLEAQAAKTTDAATPPHDEETPGSPPVDPQAEMPTGHEALPDAIEGFEPPGTPEEKEYRRGALYQAYVSLRKRGRADREALVEDVFPSAKGAYERPDEGWWEEVIQPGFDRLPEVEPVEGSGGEAWTYEGEEPAEEE